MRAISQANANAPGRELPRAIMEGRAAARGIDAYLMGETALPGN